MCAKSLQSCLTHCDLMDSRPPGSSVHGTLLARILEWIAMSSSRGSSWSCDWTHVSCSSYVVGRFFTTEPPGSLYILLRYLFFYFIIYVGCSSMLVTCILHLPFYLSTLYSFASSGMIYLTRLLTGQFSSCFQVCFFQKCFSGYPWTHPYEQIVPTL